MNAYTTTTNTSTNITKITPSPPQPQPPAQPPSPRPPPGIQNPHKSHLRSELRGTLRCAFNASNGTKTIDGNECDPGVGPLLSAAAAAAAAWPGAITGPGSGLCTPDLSGTAIPPAARRVREASAVAARASTGEIPLAPPAGGAGGITAELFEWR